MDVVELLRKYQCPENKGCNPVVDYCQCALMDSGADEIERLREANEDLHFHFDLLKEDYDQQADEIERLQEALRKAGAAVERLAFKMPPPNVWTPQFVQLGQQIARSALQQKESE